VPSDYASFAVPFGATTKMDGCAAAPVVVEPGRARGAATA